MSHVLLVGGGKFALEIVACRLAIESDRVEWVMPDISTSAARNLVAASKFVAKDVDGALNRLVVNDSAITLAKRYDELWLVHFGVQATPVANWLRLAVAPVVNLVCGVGGETVSSELASHCANQQIGLRIFCTGWPLGEHALFLAREPNPVERFLIELHEFKSEIEERIPSYFDFHALRCLCPPGGGLYLASAEDIVGVLVAAAMDADTLNRRLMVADSAPSTFGEFCEQAGEAFGVSLLSVNQASQLNPVDECFQQRIYPIAQQLVSADVIDSYTLPPGRTSHFDHDGQTAAMKQLRQSLDRLCSHRNQSNKNLFLKLKLQSVEACPDLTYFRAGKGEIPVVLINALGQGLAFWTRLFDILSRHHYVLIWEPRGLLSPIDFCLEDHVTDLERILDREAISCCRLVGWCTGPKVALEFYRRRPDAVESMVFLNPSLKGPGLSEDLDTIYEHHLEPLCKLLSRRPDMASYVRNALIDSISRSAEENEADFPSVAVSAMNVDLKQPVLQPFSSEFSTVSYCRQLLDFWSHDAAAIAADTGVPVLLLAAEFDRVASPVMAQAVRDLLPEADYVEIPGATHYCLYDRPALVAGLMEAFFQRAAARTASGVYCKHTPPQPEGVELAPDQGWQP